MPISVNWDNQDQTILRITVADPWTIHEACKLLGSVDDSMLANQTIVPDAIIDMYDAHTSPSGLSYFWRSVYGWLQTHQFDTAIVALVQAPPALVGVGDILRNMRIPIMRHVHFVNSFDNARTIINTTREHTPPQNRNAH